MELVRMGNTIRTKAPTGGQTSVGASYWPAGSIAQSAACFRLTSNHRQILRISQATWIPTELLRIDSDPCARSTTQMQPTPESRLLRLGESARNARIQLTVLLEQTQSIKLTPLATKLTRRSKPIVGLPYVRISTRP